MLFTEYLTGCQDTGGNVISFIPISKVQPSCTDFHETQDHSAALNAHLLYENHPNQTVGLQAGSSESISITPFSEVKNGFRRNARSLSIHLLTYLLTPWSRILLDKLTGSQLLKKFPAFYGIRRFATAFTTVRQLCLFWSRSIQSVTPTFHFLKIRLNIILPSKPGSPKLSFSFRFPHQNPVYASPLPHTHSMPRPFHFSRVYHPNNIGRTPSWSGANTSWKLLTAGTVLITLGI